MNRHNIHNIQYKFCPRCVKGSLTTTTDEYGRSTSCINCGHTDNGTAIVSHYQERLEAWRGNRHILPYRGSNPIFKGQFIVVDVREQPAEAALLVPVCPYCERSMSMETKSGNRPAVLPSRVARCRRRHRINILFTNTRNAGDREVYGWNEITK